METQSSSQQSETARRRAESELVIGEVVEAATTTFIAQCVDCERTKERQLFEPPEFGSFIKVKPLGTRHSEAQPPAPAIEDDEADPFSTPFYGQSNLAPAPALVSAPGTLYAAVSHASMTALDAGRRPTALGYADEDELRKHQPQIFELITTEFTGVLLAYADTGGQLRRALPPRPPRLHSQVFPCSTEEIIALSDDLQFLQRVLNGSMKLEASPYDLCAAIVRQAWQARGSQAAYLHQAGLQLSALLGGDYEALQTILRSIVA